MITKLYTLHEGSLETVRYVGKTSHSLSSRLGRHLYDARKGGKTHKCNWIREVLSRGGVIRIAEVLQVEGSGAEVEVQLIKEFRLLGEPLTNCTEGGEGAPGYKMSQVNREAMRKRKTGVRHTAEVIERIAAQNRGKKLSEEHRARISEGLLKAGYVPTEEVRKAASERMRGRVVAEEVRQKIRESLTGRKNGPIADTTREKIRKRLMGNNNMGGKTHSEETKARMRAAALLRVVAGRKLSEETKSKMRASQLLRHARRKGALDATNDSVDEGE